MPSMYQPEPQSQVMNALIIFMISIVIFYILEISLGTALDQMIATFMTIESARPEMTTPVLNMLRQWHRVLLLFVIVLAVWVFRVATSRADYSRGF